MKKFELGFLFSVTSFANFSSLLHEKRIKLHPLFTHLLWSCPDPSFFIPTKLFLFSAVSSFFVGIFSYSYSHAPILILLSSYSYTYIYILCIDHPKLNTVVALFGRFSDPFVPFLEVCVLFGRPTGNTRCFKSHFSNH